MIPTSLIVFVAVTSIAVVIQMAILLALYLSVKRTLAQVESIAQDFQRRSTPLLENARDILADAAPKLKQLTSNLTDASDTLKRNAEMLGGVVTEFAVRARNQVVRADDLITRTIDRVEETTDALQHGVLKPMRRVSGIIEGLSVGLGTFLNQKRRVREDQRRATNDEGMFI